MDTEAAIVIPPSAFATLVADSATRRGSRSLNADAVATRTDPASGRVAFAVADGIGDHLLAARAARVAAAAAALAATRQGARAGILAAQQQLLHEFPEPQADCVLVVAVLPGPGLPDLPTDIAWVGDCRAYRWNDRMLHQITSDHTVAEYLRARGIQAAPRLSHVVTTSVRTVQPEAVGHAATGSSHGRLLLCTDGAHKPLTMPAIKHALSRAATPAIAANLLVDSALRAGGSDNSTAIVIDRH
ncbi:PP2C family protein-serine/threonine phosphatase [Nocardia sp. NPDC020380]|uniref:PP2C family protein-serine/threonine phosphatase n=1 Tax=Nocardia sp. NPDC020380 TaxID=3364309 RepID=UPI0037BD1FD1